MAASPQPSLSDKATTLFLCAQKIAERTPEFFNAKGPGAGDRASVRFMEDVRQLARDLLGDNYSEKRLVPSVISGWTFTFPMSRRQ